MKPTDARAYMLAKEINPEAGMHAVSADPRELAAAEEAVKRSWRAFPYYPHRYGERGQKFSLSDSGWLATLCDSPPQVATQQVLWLGGLLAARGMPRYLLETHLEYLHEELVRAAAYPGARYENLRRCAEALRAPRVRVMSDDAFQALGREFDATVADEKGRVSGMGAVLTAAVCDDAAGLEGVTANVAAWATDETRFSPRWIEAVAATLAAARARLKSSACAPESPAS